MMFNFSKPRRVYCAGPYSPIVNKANPGSRAAKAEIAAHVDMAKRVGEYVRNRDEIPFVPHVAIPQGTVIEVTWRTAMLECLSHLATCHAVVLIPGWEHSRGARIENWVARRLLKIPVYTLHEYERSFVLTPLKEVACA